VRNLIEEAGKSQDRATPKLVWKTKCGHKNCFAIQESP